MRRPQTVVEFLEFWRRAKAVMADAERGAIDFIAANPEAGVSLGGGLGMVHIPARGVSSNRKWNENSSGRDRRLPDGLG